MFLAPQKEICYFSNDGCVKINPQELMSEKFLWLHGGKFVISTDKELGVLISTPGEKMVITMQDGEDGEFHETLLGTYVSCFSKSGCFIQASGLIVLFPGIRLMNIEFNTLCISSDITGDRDFNLNGDFNFNGDFKPQTQKPKAPPKQSQPASKAPPKQSQPAPKASPRHPQVDPVVFKKKFRGMKIANLFKVKTVDGVRFNKPKGRRPIKFPFWSTTKGDWFEWVDSLGRPAPKAGKEAKSTGGIEPIEDEDFGEEATEMESEKEVGGFPLYKVSTGKLADNSVCELGQYSFCARPKDFGIVSIPDAVVGACAYKIEGPTDLGKFLMEQTKMGFFCCKVNKSCGMTLSIGVEIEGVVYGVFRDTGSRKPQSLGVNVDFIPNCITPLYVGILEGRIAIDCTCTTNLEACINNWYNMSKLRTNKNSKEQWKLLFHFAELCEEGKISDWKKFQNPEAGADLEFDVTAFYEMPEVPAGQKQSYIPNLPFMKWLWEHYSFDPTEEAPISAGEDGEAAEEDEYIEEVDSGEEDSGEEDEVFGQEEESGEEEED